MCLPCGVCNVEEQEVDDDDDNDDDDEEEMVKEDVVAFLPCTRIFFM